ncbi:RdgB/HAM1 family non-canonical purine NTP pyrophosphatase [Lysobacter sp. N42]|uniref:RdgB/HAM1 family non-canonical purine NTP pyrophosphatase n=2 Tax=Gammaproteobacteria TaxID=1236 RepID=UPI000DD003ED|nr:RdgB/HAM1 family non-canonical purine NTP pyrophosphatase [Lysobacter sp. N42]RTE87824.1 RdgB/HAM1 family non-canonical purine NTP pyrophosphatase [Aliidiomarina sp. B3213]TCZ93402.1 RdgB/HAM1 family non-canonical purine NTP pyrophosphatase [Lysobacter sp. N42]
MIRNAPEKLVLASGNQGKLKELKSLLEPLNISVHAQNEFNVGDVAETGLTFVENAIIKARHASAITKLPALADDSGLAVDALNGGPGIYSARYSGEGATDQKNIDKLLADMIDIPAEDRTAAFHCVLVYVEHTNDPTPLIAHGVWQGTITQEQSGSEGFGYDPVFYIASHQCTAAQLSREQKQAISHRGIALRKLIEGFKSTA